MLIRAQNVLLNRGVASRYEERFSQSLLEAVRPGDCVWDVGANVGLYTAWLSDRVGPGGVVYAFEPAPACFQELVELGRANVQVLNMALGDVEGQMPLKVERDPLGATHSLVDGAEGCEHTVDVRVARGDDVVRELGIRLPNVIKVDVEGFEEDVIRGLVSTLSRPECRAVFCEVHFAILERRGTKHAPASIEARLKGLGYVTRWIDASHLSAVRS